MDGNPTEFLSKFRRCLCKYTSSNNVSICYLNDTDSNYYHDGTTKADLTGAEGEVMVYFPEFWYIGETTNTQNIFHFSTYEVEGYYHSPESLVGAYKMYAEYEWMNANYDKPHSWSGVLPTIGLANSTIRPDVDMNGRGDGFRFISYHEHCVIAWMFMLRYNTRDISLLGSSIEYDRNNPSTEIDTGSTNSLGVIDTEKDSIARGSLINFLGLEGAWGYINEYISNISFTRTNLGGTGTFREVLMIHDNAGIRYIGNIGILNYTSLNGYLVNLNEDSYMDLISTSLSNSLSDSAWRSYFDIYGWSSDGNYPIYRSVPGHMSGIASLITLRYYSNGGDYPSISSRLAFSGTIKEVNSISSFKSIKDAVMG